MARKVKVTTSIFDPLVEKYTGSMRLTSRNFSEAKEETITVISSALQTSQKPEVIVEYKKMLASVEKSRNWDHLARLIFNEKLAREDLRVLYIG